MDRLNFLLVTLAERLFRPAHNVRLQILEAQIRFLRSRIEASRIVRSPEEKHELLSKPESTGHGEIFSSCRKTFLCRVNRRKSFGDPKFSPRCVINSSHQSKCHKLVNSGGF